MTTTQTENDDETVDDRNTVTLTDQQIEEHRRDEQVIEDGLSTFVAVGRALIRIRDRRSYLLTHETFGKYTRDRWRLDASYVYRLIAGAEVVDVLEGEGVEVMPANTRVAYELRGLTKKPRDLVKAWKRTIDEYGERPTGRELARSLRGESKPTTRRARDNGGAASIDESKLSEVQSAYDAKLTQATEALVAMKAIQMDVLHDADLTTRRNWSRRISQLRAVARDVARAVDSRL